MMDFPNRNPNADLAFGVLSDLHMNAMGEGLQKLNQYLDLYSRIEPKIDAHVFAGDTVYQIDSWSGGGPSTKVFEEPYIYLRLSLDRYAKDVPLVYTLGNHEYCQTNYNAELDDAARAVAEKYGYPENSHTVIKGYHFISVGIHNWAMQFTPETEAWAMKEIRSALRADKEKPVFVVYHTPIRGSVPGARDGRHSEAFKKLLLSSKRLINICGHTHCVPEDPKTIWQRKGGATIIHAPNAAVGNAHIPGSSRHAINGLFYSRSLFFEVVGTKVIIHKIDNLTEKETGKPWVVDVAPDGVQYYTDRRKTISKKPAFPKGTKVHAEWRHGIAVFKFDKAACVETAGNDDSDVPNYRFEFMKKGESEPVFTTVWNSDYCRSFHHSYFYSPIPDGGKLESGLYTVKITPISFFEKEGRPITAKLRVPEDKGEAPKWLYEHKVLSMV